MKRRLQLAQDLVGSKISLEISYVDKLGFEESIWSSNSDLVQNVNDAPALESVATQSVVEDSYWSYQIGASDPDSNDELNFTLSSDFSWLEINKTSGLLFGDTYLP